MRVREVDPASPLFGTVRPGHSLRRLNGKPVADDIDFRFRSADTRVALTFADRQGREYEVEVDGTRFDLGLAFEEGKIRRCKCNCIFCFVHQQPKGMRRSLYLKDEDYRLSFTHGNFITLSNVSDEDVERIITQRLSPLYVSVHTTDDRLRREMLGNRAIRPILPQLRRLVAAGIQLHTQAVICPGINDGDHLEKTIGDLAALYPGVASLAVVPVGLTRYRERLPKLRIHTPAEAKETIDLVESRQRELKEAIGSRFVWAADEFYVNAGREFPSHKSYEAMPQFENGVGMAREFVTGFNRRRRTLKLIRSRKKVLMVTGQSAGPFLRRQVVPYLTDELRLKLKLQIISNRFWGESVTVSGLLTGQDILDELASTVSGYDSVVLPPTCLNGDNLFLDDISLDDFQKSLGRPVIVGSYNLADTIKEVFS